jgi:calcium-dependent protein kinase
MLVSEHKGNFYDFYFLIKTIGEGSFGKVYKVRQRGTNKVFAMKLVKRDNNFHDGNRDFLNEIYILRKLDHPNILKIFEFFTDKKYFYFIMDYVSGGDLYSQIIEIEHYTEVIAAKIIKQLFSCVTYLHKMNIIHRDLKLENMMVSYYNEKEEEIEIKLIDFGTACFYKNDKKLSLKIGSPFYIAPEVIKGSYGFECDIWSCGIILYILLSGLPPFQGRSNKETFKYIVNSELEFGPKWKKISDEAKDLVKRCLEKDPDKRIKEIDALHHPFVLNNTSIKGGNIEKKISLKNTLQNFTSKQKLKQAAIAFIVHQISNTKITLELKKIFNQLDTTGDGLLTKDDLKKGYKKFFTDDINDEDFDEIIKLIDQDNSGEISIEEFLRATIDYENIITEKNLKYAFDYFDKDGNGTLDKEEIRDLLGLSEENEKTKNIIDNIVKEIDSNGDGLIDFEEFKTMMKKNKEFLFENNKKENLEDEIE